MRRPKKFFLVRRILTELSLFFCYIKNKKDYTDYDNDIRVLL